MPLIAYRRNFSLLQPIHNSALYEKNHKDRTGGTKKVKTGLGKAVIKSPWQVWEEGVSEGQARQHHQGLGLAGSPAPASHWQLPALGVWAQINPAWPRWSAARGRQDKHSVQRGKTPSLPGKEGILRSLFCFSNKRVPHTEGPGTNDSQKSEEEEGSIPQKTKHLQL